MFGTLGRPWLVVSRPVLCLLRPGLLDLFTEADEDKSSLDLEDTGWLVSGVEMGLVVQFGLMTMQFGHF